MTRSAAMKILICTALVATALIIAASREPSSHDDHVDAPTFSTASPPQTAPRSGQ
jgi:hypothetical protein